MATKGDDWLSKRITEYKDLNHRRQLQSA